MPERILTADMVNKKYDPYNLMILSWIITLWILLFIKAFAFVSQYVIVEGNLYIDTYNEVRKQHDKTD